MKRQIVIQLALLCLGESATVWSQTRFSPLTTRRATVVVEVVASPAGAAVRSGEAGFGSLGLGHNSWASEDSQSGVKHTKDGNSFSMATAVGLRLECPAADAGRRASISAVLREPDPRYMVSLDDVALTAAPVVISPLAFCGSTTRHTISVKVPVSSSAGPIDANIGFQVTLQ
jgi:hypothetical protein